jgi:hypothetical protein
MECRYELLYQKTTGKKLVAFRVPRMRQHDDTGIGMHVLSYLRLYLLPHIVKFSAIFIILLTQKEKIAENDQ